MRELSKEQRAHIDNLAKTWIEMMAKKYENGVREHGGNLWERSITYLLDQAIYENIDQFVYLQTLRDKLSKPKACDRIGGCLKINLNNPLTSCKCDPQDE